MKIGLAFEGRGEGLARWRSLADAALDEVGRDVPIFVGSCNGASREPWSTAFEGLSEHPIASAACASGLQALWLAQTRLAHDCDEVIVLACDILSPASHANFDVLRVLSSRPRPWQADSDGFREGEAAVAIRLRRGEVMGPLLGNDNLAGLVHAIGTNDIGFVVGQGTGPASVDMAELAALADVPRDVPLTTALVTCGHTLGASGLLSLALAVRRDERLSTVDRTAIDGRALSLDTRSVAGDALVVCRALGGSSAVARVASTSPASTSPASTSPASTSPASTSSAAARVASISPSISRGHSSFRQVARWVAPTSPPPLRLPLLRRIAQLPRPSELPDVLVVRLDAPLDPSEADRIGSRLLPSVVLEITPGFVAQLLAQTWGFDGPAVTVVGGSDAAWLPTLAAIRAVHGKVLVLHVHARDFEWEP